MSEGRDAEWPDDAAAALPRLLTGQARRGPAPPPLPDGRARGDWRLGLVMFVFLLAFGTVGLRMTALALAGPSEPRLAATASRSAATRAPIVDRAGRPLALNLPAWSAYAHPREMDDPAAAAQRLAAALPGTDAEALAQRFERSPAFAWIKRPVTPVERQAVHDLGLPGVYFGTRDVRIYPAGRMAAHVLGGVQAGTEDVHFAEALGLAGVERRFDETLRDPARDGEPLRLSIDLPVQAALTEVLRAGVERFHAVGGSAVLMDARTGAVLALVSLPDFDPNARPVPTDPEVVRTRPLMNRAAEGVFEMGSTFKPIYAALAIERGLVTPETMIDARGPMAWGRHRIRDSYRMPPEMSVADAMAKSSNVVTARLAIMLTTPVVRAFLDRIGFKEPTAIEIAEASLGRPLQPERWADISTITIGFGYGLAVTQLHMAAAYAAMVNGGLLVSPTLDPEAVPPGEDARILSPRTSAAMRAIMRHTVTWGTAKAAEAPGYEVGGKTGTAEKANPAGGYLRDKTRTSFVGAFPMSDPRYVISVSLDEPELRTGPRPVRTAGATAAPVAGEAVARVAPLLGLRPALPPKADGATIADARP